jgi:hypothetical protein
LSDDKYGERRREKGERRREKRERRRENGEGEEGPSPFTFLRRSPLSPFSILLSPLV